MDQRDEIFIAGLGGGRQEEDRVIRGNYIPQRFVLGLDASAAQEFIDKATGATSGEDGLLNDLAKAEQANMHVRPCQVCEAIQAMSESARVGVVRALAGTIGERTLADILTRNGYPTGRRAVARHRLEGHSS